MFRQAQTRLDIPTHGPGLYEITTPLNEFVADSGVVMGQVTAFCLHTSASLLMQENADPDVQRDLLVFFRRIAPDGANWMVHQTEGPDDMPGHIKSALTQTSITIPVTAGAPRLGEWQGLYVFEHRTNPHRRQVVLHVIGDDQ